MILVLIIVIPSIAAAVDWCSEELQCPHEVPPENTMCRYRDEMQTPRCTEMVVLQNSTNRRLIVRLHNEYRRRIAMGEVPGWPAAANMKRLRYDKTLEKIAFRWARQCWPDHDRCRKTQKWQFVGQNIALEYSSVPKLVADPVSDVNEWWNEIRNINPMIVDSFYVQQSSKAHFTQMIWATTEKIGCAIVAYKLNSGINCPYLRFTVCNYGPGGNIVSHPVYERGPPCSRCLYGDCVCDPMPIKHSYFVKSGLPWLTTVSNTIQNSISSVFKPVMRFYEPILPTTIKKYLNSPQIGTREYWCSENMECKNEFPPQHTMCLYRNEVQTSRCTGIVSLMTDCDREKLVRSHNFYRRKIAMGEVPGWPSAANMRMLTYDETLEKIAYRWATQCVEEHDKCRKTSKWWSVGQNIAREYGQRPRTTTNPEGDVEAWWNELDDTNPTIIDGFFVQAHKKSPSGHFIQLVWADTEKVGCAMVSYKVTSPSHYPYVRVTICNYGPSGNVLTYPVYEKGPPCSRCPPNATCVCDFKPSVIAVCNETDLSDFKDFANPHIDYNYPVSPYSRTPEAAFGELMSSQRSTVHGKLASRDYVPYTPRKTAIQNKYKRTHFPKTRPQTMLVVPGDHPVSYPPFTQLGYHTNQPGSRKLSSTKKYSTRSFYPFQNRVTSRTSMTQPTGNKELACMVYQGIEPPFVVAYERPKYRFVSDLPLVAPEWEMVLPSTNGGYSGMTTAHQRGFQEFPSGDFTLQNAYLQG